MLESSAEICDSHYSFFVNTYKPTGELITSRCCDPLNLHRDAVKRDLRKISLIAVMKGRDRGLNLKAGEFCCKNCRQQVLNLPILNQTEVREPSGGNNSQKDSDSLPASGSSGLSPCVRREDAIKSLQAFGVPAFSSSLRSRVGRVKEGKRKLELAADTARKKVCVAFDLELEDLRPDDSVAAEDLRLLMEEIRNKLPFATQLEKYRLLSLCPLSWTISQAANYFNVSRYVVNKARALRNEKGILSTPEPKGGLRVLQEVRKQVVEFYCMDECSRLMPGKKDFISIGRNKHVQKRLLLDDLKVLHQTFKEKYPCMKIGFSLFCALRPKWCVLVGQPGTHTVCVCQIHQDVKLLFHALRIQEDYKDIISSIVCDTSNRTCILGLCEQCSSLTKIKEMLEAKVCAHVESTGNTIVENDENCCDYLEENVEYKQWISTDRTELVTRINTRREVVDMTAEKLKALIPHHYIAKQQAKYVKGAKENLNSAKVMVLMDFSMNYSCILQDEVQSYHWGKKQATVHPVVIYYKDKDTVEYQNLCFISDDLTHDSHLVKKIQSETVNYVRENLPTAQHVEYVTDGCAAQYKNKKSFYTLCQHKKLFGLTASHSYFATSHGKSTCDGIGAIVKRSATRASLQRPLDNQITDARKLFGYCCSSEMSKTIHFLFISRDEVEIEREKENTFILLPVPGTRSFHNYVPVSEQKVGCKAISLDDDYSLIHSLTEDQSGSTVKVRLGDYVAVKINRRRYIGLVSDLCEDEGEVDISLLYPPLPAKTFTWPEELNCLVVPVTDILQTVSLSEESNNKYSLSELNAKILCKRRR